MSIRGARRLVILCCLALGPVGVSSRAAAADSSKIWPSKKKKKHHKTHHHASTSTSAAKAATKASGAAPAEDADEDGGDDSVEDDQKDEQDERKNEKQGEPVKAKPKKTSTAPDAEEREASDDKGEREEGDDIVVRHRARPPASEGGAAPVAVELSAGPRAVHRTFDFNDPLSNYQAGAAKPYSYVLPAGPAPFVDLGFYPAAFATRGFLANVGVVASYERLIATKTQSATASTLAQQLEVGLRGRLPLGEHEAGLAVSYGKQTFHVSDTDPGPATGTVPNVDYTFIDVSADGRFRVNALTFGAHVGTRLVRDTGSLEKVWFPTTKTTSIEAGLSAGYRLTPMFEVVGGVDLMRYAFDFNPVPPMNPLVAGGAVDQYISGYLALRVSITGG